MSVECRVPQFLLADLFHLAGAGSLEYFDDQRNSLDNLKGLLQDGLLTADAVTMEIYNLEILVSNTGVVYRNFRSNGSYLDAEETVAEIEVRQEIGRLRSSVSNIISNRVISNYVILPGHLSHRVDNADHFQEAMDFERAERQNLIRVLEARDQILRLDSNQNLGSFDAYISNINFLTEVKSAFEELNDGIRFERVRIERGSSGGLSLFGTYHYSGTTEIKRAGATVLFKDQSGNVIGRQYYTGFFSDLHPGKVHGFGWRIDNQVMATRAVSVEIVPATITSLR